jgi:predicted PurR-regulated permease PerM
MTISSAAATRRAFYFLATLLLTTALLYWGATVLVPLALAILLAFVLNVPQHWLEQKGLPRYISVPLVASAAFALLGGLGWIAAGEFRSLADELPEYEETIKKKIEPLRHWLHQAQKIESKVTAAAPKASPKEEKEAPPPVPVVVESQGSMFLGWFGSMLGPILDIGARTVLVLVLTAFILARHENLSDRFLRLVGPSHLARATKGMQEAGRRVRRYLLLQTCTNSCIGVGVTLGLYLIGVPYPLLWGLFSAVLRFVPYVGIWLSASFPLVLSIATAADWMQPLLVIGLYLVLELLMSNVVEPLLFGHSTGVTPVALLIAAVFWAWLWGPIGLLLSTPLTVCLVVLAKHAPALAFLSVLLEDAPALASAARFYQRLLAHDEVGACQMLQAYLKSHPPPAVYDEVLLPALIRLRQDRQKRQLTVADEKVVLRLLHAMLSQALLCAPARPEQKQGAAVRDLAPKTRVIGCPARGMADELAVEMLRQALDREQTPLEIVPPSKVVEALRDGWDPAQRVTVCIVALAPGGISACVNFCKGCKAELPGIRVLVGRWGGSEDEEQEAERLRAAGADDVATTVLALRTQIIAPPKILQLPAPA